MSNFWEEMLVSAGVSGVVSLVLTIAISSWRKRGNNGR